MKSRKSLDLVTEPVLSLNLFFSLSKSYKYSSGAELEGRGGDLSESLIEFKCLAWLTDVSALAALFSEEATISGSEIFKATFLELH